MSSPLELGAQGSKLPAVFDTESGSEAGLLHEEKAMLGEKMKPIFYNILCGESYFVKKVGLDLFFFQMPLTFFVFQKNMIFSMI